MSIGILFDSIEWSNSHLAEIIQSAGIEAELINVDTDPICFDRIGRHDLVINRLFPSAFFRGHERAHSIAQTVAHAAHVMRKKMINPYEAFAYDWSKICTGLALKKNAIPTPQWYSYFLGSGRLDKKRLVYPCVIKPDCGGRSMHTYVLQSDDDLERVLKELPPIPFIVQEYIEPTKKYTTRIEIVGGNVVSIMKRTVGDNDISSYHSNSIYEDYAECPTRVVNSALKALELLHIEMGSLDIIEAKDSEFYIIDINATSNFSQDNIAMFGYDPILPMAEYIISEYSNCNK